MRNTKKKSKKKPLELKVVFDSNAIFSQTGSYILKNEVFELITNSQHDDLSITWYLPEVVRHERQYQLQKQSLDLLPSIQKLEKLLGHNLLITDQIIIQRVHEGIEKQISDLRISVLSLEPSSVDWNRLMLDSAYRRPPFSAGEKEKGFRDALIAEAFHQLVEVSPKTVSICRIVLITEDNLLTQAVESRVAGSNNVRVLPSLEELKGLINTLVSQVTLEYVEKVKGRAALLFFEAGDESLYSKENILKQLIERYGDKVNERPAGADERKHVKTLIGRPRFVRKIGQRIHWISRVVLRIETYRNEQIKPLTAGAISGYSGYSGYDPSLQPPLLSYDPLKAGTGSITGAITGSIPPELPLTWPWSEEPKPQSVRQLYKTGHIIFEVAWSVAVTTANKLTKAKIESIDYVETTWE